MYKLISSILYLLFPNRCPFCDICIPQSEHSCDECREKMDNIIPIVTEAIPPDFWFEMAYSRFPYEGEMAKAIIHLKQYGFVQTADNLGHYLAEIWKAESSAPFDLICYVPMHRKKLRQQGYNPAHQLAKGIGRYWKVPVVHALEKPKLNLAQHTLTQAQRQLNVLDAFAVNQKVFVQGKRILLVDDVLTTGATVTRCSELLHKAGAQSVTVATICKTIAGIG